jgi:outer membrane protein insertion porin family
VGTGGAGNFFLSSNLQAQNFLGTGKTVAVGVNKSRFQTGLNFQYLDPYFTPDGVSRGFSLFAQDIESPFNVSDFNTTSFGGSLSFSYPLSEIELLGFDLGYRHTELSAGFGSVQEIASSPILLDGIDRFIITPANPNIADGPVVDAVLGNVSDLRPAQLQANSEPGFIDRFGDTFDNFTITGSWLRNTLNKGQLPTAGSLHKIGVEVTLPGSDLEYANFSYNNQMYWPITEDHSWVVGFRTNLGYGLGYGDTEELPFFNNYFAGGLTSAGIIRGFEDNSLGPQSTPGARYLTGFGVTLQRGEDGEILLNEDGSAVGFNRDQAYQTVPAVDGDGNPVLDPNGNQEIALAVQNFFLDDDFDSFGGNILATATLELLFPLPFIEQSGRVRSAFFVDAGNVFSSYCTERQELLSNCSDFDLGEIRYSAGIGVTYLSPFGPLTFYVAKPFGKDGDDTKTFDFTISNGF